MGPLSKAARAARKRRLRAKRRSIVERLEPRVVLNAAPVALPDPIYSTPQNTQLIVTSQDTTLLDNDWDPEGNSVTATLVTSPAGGSVTNFGSDGTFTYTPNNGFTGFDTFRYKISDGSVESETVDVTIAVGGDMSPRTN